MMTQKDVDEMRKSGNHSDKYIKTCQDDVRKFEREEQSRVTLEDAHRKYAKNVWPPLSWSEKK